VIIGLTGGIACGKSTVAQMLVSRGAHLVDADLIAREVVLPGSPVLDQVALYFGQDVIQVDGSLHRKKLGEIIFGDESAKKALESILHPPIREIMWERMNRLDQEKPQGLVAVDIPLMYESGLDTKFKEIMVVYIPRELQLKRLIARDGISDEQAESRLNSQWPIEEKKDRADIVIDNSGTLEQTEAQISEFWHRKELR
jgi:dephospho-CoA kinase